MKPFILLTCFILCFFLVTCFAQTTGQNDKPLPVLDKTKSYLPKKFEFDSEVTYIPLETSKNVLLGGSCKLRYVSNEKFVISDMMSGDVFIFDKNGKALSKFNQKGGLGYTFLSFIAYDEKRNEVYILDYIVQKIFVFSENGALLRSYITPQNTSLTEIYNFDDNTLLALNEDKNGSGKPIKPYVYIAKNDGKILGYVNIELPKSIPTRIEGIGKSGTGFFSIVHYGIPDNCKFGNDFVLANKSMDTIYLLKQDKTLIPLFTQTPSVYSEHPTAASIGMIANQLLKICISSYDLQEAKKTYDRGANWRPMFQHFIFDIKSGEFFEDSGSGYFAVERVDIQKNQSARLLQAMHLVDAYKKGLLKDKIKEVASKLDIGDNPIIEIKKFKY